MGRYFPNGLNVKSTYGDPAPRLGRGWRSGTGSVM